MNVVFYTNYPPDSHHEGGGALAIWSTARALAAKHEINLTVCFPDNGGTHQIDFLADSQWHGLQRCSQEDIRDLVAELKPDIFHGFGYRCSKALEYCRKSGIPCVYEVRSPTCHPCRIRHRLEFPLHKMWRSTFAGMLDRKAARRADYVLVPSKTALEPLRKHYGIQMLRSGYAHNGVDHTIFYRKSPPSAKPKRPFRLINAGRITHGRNFDMTISVYESLLPSYPDLTLSLVGTGTALAGLQKYASQKGLRGITFHGSVNHHTLADLYRESDLLINTSQAESFGNVVAEAMSCGLPVIAFAVGSLPEVVGPEARKYLSDFGDLAAMVENARAFLDDNKLRETIGHYQTELARERYSWPTRADKIKIIYDRILTSHL